MKMLLAGATGLVGNQVLALGLDQGHEVTTVGRRPTGHASSEIVSSFTELPNLPLADVAICALGTTIRQAGSKEAFAPSIMTRSCHLRQRPKQRVSSTF